MSPAELQTAVAQGGRFVVFQYCVSLLVVSLKRSSPLYFIRPGESAFTRSLPYTLISFVAGWWGIPWGPIWTLMTMAGVVFAQAPSLVFSGPLMTVAISDNLTGEPLR